MSHTPGPWVVGPDSKYHQQSYIPVLARVQNMHWAVAWVVMDEETHGDNVRLIAAAPDLLSALEEIRDLLHESTARPDYEVRREALALAENACARASAEEDPNA